MESILNSAVTVIVALVGAGLLQYRSNRRRTMSEAQVNESNAELVEGQLTINLSAEARQLIEIYKGNAQEARQEAVEAKRIATQDRARLDFVVAYLRSQNIPIPEFPEALK